MPAFPANTYRENFYQIRSTGRVGHARLTRGPWHGPKFIIRWNYPEARRKWRHPRVWVHLITYATDFHNNGGRAERHDVHPLPHPPHTPIQWATADGLDLIKIFASADVAPRELILSDEMVAGLDLDGCVRPSV